MKRIVTTFVYIVLILFLGNSPSSFAQSRSRLLLEQNTRPFQLLRYISPVEPSNTPYERAHCVDIDNGLRVCKYISHSETFFAIEKNGSTLGEFETSTYHGGTSRFEVLRSDLDGDGKTELIIANSNGMSNGIGLQYWTISILPDPLKIGFKQPLEFSVEEYGAEGTLAKLAGDRHRNILATEWQWSAIKEPTKYGGLYLVGRWFHYKSGVLEPVAGKPVLVRRYLLGFEKERLDTYDDFLKPLTWLSHRLTKSLFVDPIVKFKEISSLRGSIQTTNKPAKSPSTESYRDRPEQILVRLDNGKSALYHYSDDGSKTIDTSYFRIGNAQSGILYPKRYVPAKGNQWLVGKRVRITSYKDQYDEVRNIIWVN